MSKIVEFIYGKHPFCTICSCNYLFTRKNLQWVKKYAKEITGETTIDFGCGKVPYFKYFEPYTNKFYALDFSFSDKITESEKIFKTKLGNDGSIDKSVPSADTILSFQVLMEVDDLDFYFNEIDKFSHKGSRLFVTSAWGMPAVGDNDKYRVSPFLMHRILSKYGFDIVKYKASGYFFATMGLSMNLLLVSKNKYDIRTSEIKFSRVKALIFTPIIILINIFAIVLDYLIPLRRSPANWLIIAEKNR